MNIIDTTARTWRRGKKTKGLMAKPIINLLVDKKVVNKFLIDTLEGREPLGDGTIFCIGEGGDAWQQSSKALLKKYEVKSIDADGWMICEPRPENEVEFFEVTPEMTMAGENAIIGLWGETIGDVEKCQRLVAGDFVCRQPHDTSDQWVVRRTLFLNTYSELGAK